MEGGPSLSRFRTAGIRGAGPAAVQALGELEKSGGNCYNGQVLGPDDFRRAMSHFATGVTVITAWDADHRPTGLTASSFTSVSLHPPLILVCVSQKAQSYPAIKAAGRFAVNILCTGQEAVSRRFATAPSASGEEKFAGLEYRPGAGGLPVLDDALAALECTVVHAYPGGDHTIFVAQVDAADCRDQAGLEPLLYFRGKYSRLHSQPGGSR
jgi:flavin reductase (DIM6/NTAB) family NADH-FMN oxidoreductase RutF